MVELLPTLRQAWLKDGPLAAICVQNVDVQCVLQFTLIHGAGSVLHRRTSRVIHRLKLYSLGFSQCTMTTRQERQIPSQSHRFPTINQVLRMVTKKMSLGRLPHEDRTLFKPLPRSLSRTATVKREFEPEPETRASPAEMQTDLRFKPIDFPL